MSFNKTVDSFVTILARSRLSDLIDVDGSKVSFLITRSVYVSIFLPIFKG
jgi:hypothetical protein